MAAVAVADEIGIVLVNFDDPALGVPVAAADAFLNDALAGFVLGDDVAETLAFRRMPEMSVLV